MRRIDMFWLRIARTDLRAIVWHLQGVGKAAGNLLRALYNSTWQLRQGGRGEPYAARSCGAGDGATASTNPPARTHTHTRKGTA